MTGIQSISQLFFFSSLPSFPQCCEKRNYYVWRFIYGSGTVLNTVLGRSKGSV